MAITTSPNMLLPIPVIGQENDPNWSNDLNSSLSIIDTHNHTSGSGVPVPTSGLNINADLAINNNNLTTIRTLRFFSQASVPSGALDVGCLYENGVDLYYIDGSGNNIRLTLSGGVAGTPGSIAGLTSPASVGFSGTTFKFQSNSSVAGNLDAGSLTLRNLTPNSTFGLTLTPPTLTSNYTITLPSLPTVQKVVTLDSSGNLSAAYTVDGTTLQTTANLLSVATGGVGQAQKAIRTTGPSVSAGGVAISASTSTFATGSTTFVDCGVSAVLTTLGGPVFVSLTGLTPGAFAQVYNAGQTGQLQIMRNGVAVSSTFEFPNFQILPPGSFSVMDTPPAGSMTYTIQALSAAGGTTNVQNCSIVAYEL